MAKKRTQQKMTILDALPNVKHVSVTWAAASTTYVYGEWDTGIQARDGMAVLIEGFEVQPAAHPSAFVPSNSAGASFQMHRGATTGAQLDTDDARQIGTIRVLNNNAANGTFGWIGPFRWNGIPRIIVDPKITCNMDATTDVSPWQSVEWIFTISYRWVAVNLQTYVEAAEQSGVF